jgi:acetyl-CoA acetyltransferase
MISDRTGLDGARIVGVYTTEQARSLLPRTGFSLALEALTGALADAGMSLADLDGICSDISDWPAGAPHLSADIFWARQLGRPLRWPMRWPGAGVGIASMLAAIGAIGSGLASTVALVSAGVRQPQQGSVAAWTRPADEFTEWTGSYTAVQYALAAQRYIHEHGGSALEAMAEASATIRNYGSINPEAVYYGYGPLTADDVVASRPIASPLTLLMCSSVNDGAGALVLTASDRARDCAKSGIRVLAGAAQWPYPSYFEAPVLDAVPDPGAFATEALRRGEVSHDDIDVVELYDHFAIGVLMQFELYGFCGPGEASDFVRGGVMCIDGRYPTCTNGGNQSFSHNGNPVLFQPIEAVRQLRGEVPDACVGAHSHQRGVCRAARTPTVAFAANPGPPTCGGTFAVLARG